MSESIPLDPDRADGALDDDDDDGEEDETADDED